MVTVQSFLRFDEAIVPVESFSGTIGQTEHILGSLELQINGRVILSRQCWDDINWLWPLLVSKTLEVLQGKAAELWYPDQPISVTFTPVGPRGFVRIVSSEPNSAEARCHVQELGAGIAEGARHFLEYFTKLVPVSYAKTLTELDRIEQFLREW